MVFEGIGEPGLDLHPFFICLTYPCGISEQHLVSIIPCAKAKLRNIGVTLHSIACLVLNQRINLWKGLSKFNLLFFCLFPDLFGILGHGSHVKKCHQQVQLLSLLCVTETAFSVSMFYASLFHFRENISSHIL
jgi:hypothetical protein